MLAVLLTEAVEAVLKFHDSQGEVDSLFLLCCVSYQNFTELLASLRKGLLVDSTLGQ